MMASSSIILGGPYSHWLALFLVVATLLNGSLTCYAQGENCATLGCFNPSTGTQDCYCNKRCRSQNDCCHDFDYCEATCQYIRCGTQYDEGRPCQCDDLCRAHHNCCRDYNDICASDEQPNDGSERSFMLSPTVGSTKEASDKQTTDKSEGSSMLSPTVGSTKEGPSSLAVVLPTLSVLVLIISIILLGLCVTLRRRRIHKANEENVEDRNYYEVGNTNEGSYERVLPNDQGNRYERNIGYNTPTSASNNYETQLVANVAYESYS